MIKKVFISALVFFPLLTLADCTRFPVEAYDAYATTDPEHNQMLHAYVTIKNRDITSHTLNYISSMMNSPRSIEIQSYSRNSSDNNILLGDAEQILLPANGGVIMLRPQSTHIVLDGYKDRPNPDDTIDLTFSFANGCSVTITNVPVQNPAED